MGCRLGNSESIGGVGGGWVFEDIAYRNALIFMLKERLPATRFYYLYNGITLTKKTNKDQLFIYGSGSNK